MDIKSFEKYHDLFFDNYNQPVECTFVGYPSEDGCGAYIIPNGRFGISANSAPEKQKGAWLFIKKLLEYDYQYEWGKYCFPVNYSAFSKLGENEYFKRINIFQIQVFLPCSELLPLFLAGFFHPIS